MIALDVFASLGPYGPAWYAPTSGEVSSDVLAKVQELSLDEPLCKGGPNRLDWFPGITSFLEEGMKVTSPMREHPSVSSTFDEQSQRLPGGRMIAEPT